MPLNQQLKERFFAQYLHAAKFQLKYINVDRMSDPQILTVKDIDICFNVHELKPCWLVLRRINQITFLEGVKIRSFKGDTGLIFDYLRSIGVEAPLGDYMAEDFHKAGWFKYESEV